MGLENIIGKILEEAEQEARRLREEAQARAAKLIASSQEEAQKKAAEIISQAEQEAQMEALSLMAQARLEKKLALLEVKRKWVDLILNKAFEEAGLEESSLKKTVVTREDIKWEKIDAEKLKQELRHRFEKTILDLLGI